MNFKALAMAAGLALTLATNAFAAPLANIRQIDAQTDIRVIPVAQVSGVNVQRVSAIAGIDVDKLRYVGLPTNPYLENELGDGGYVMPNLVALYSDDNGVVWAFVDPHRLVAAAGSSGKDDDDDDDDDDDEDDEDPNDNPDCNPRICPTGNGPYATY